MICELPIGEDSPTETILRSNTDAAFESIVAAIPKTGATWATAVHRAVARNFPDAFVYRAHFDLEELSRWIQAHALPLTGDVLHTVHFDEDRDGVHVYPEGGCFSFRWQGEAHHVLGLLAADSRRHHEFAWIASPDRASAERLADAVHRHAQSTRADVMAFEEGDWEVAPRLATNLAAYSWNSVVLPEADKTRIRGTAERFFQSQPVYERLGIPWKLGYLFMGPPGTGKTLTTKVLAAESKVPFLYVRALEHRYSSTPDAKTLRDLFRGARDRAPCILCLEDVDSLVPEDLRSAFLNELDGLEDGYRGVLTVATTNHPEKLDMALLNRPSRFDFRFRFPLPNEGQRRALIGHWVERVLKAAVITTAAAETGRGPELDAFANDPCLQQLVRKSRGMSHAYLKRVMIATATRMYHEQVEGPVEFFRIALEEVQDAGKDRASVHRIETATGDAENGARIGFQLD